MPALTSDINRTLTQTLPELTDYLREIPDPVEALAPVEALLDEYTGLPAQHTDTLRALTRGVQDDPHVPGTAQIDLLTAELRRAAWEQADQHKLHYVFDDLRALYGSPVASEPGCCLCR